MEYHLCMFAWCVGLNDRWGSEVFPLSSLVCRYLMNSVRLTIFVIAVKATIRPILPLQHAVLFSDHSGGKRKRKLLWLTRLHLHGRHLLEIVLFLPCSFPARPLVVRVSCVQHCADIPLGTQRFYNQNEQVLPVSENIHFQIVWFSGTNNIIIMKEVYLLTWKYCHVGT